MKTTTKISSFLGGLVIAFAITLFLPSAANATWGNYNHGSHGYKKQCSHGSKAHGSKKHGSKAHGSKNHGSSNHCTVNCSKYEKLADKYQKLADKYLTKYNNTHCYTYYHKYLCFAKKAALFKKKLDQCEANSTIDCDKYKILADKYKDSAVKYKAYADKYLAAYNNTNGCWSWKKKCYYKYYLCNLKKYESFMKLYNENMDKYNNCQAQNVFGSVTGYIYEDVNENGQKDTGEKGVAGIHVTIIDNNGKTYTAITDADGKYYQADVPAGSASVTVVETTLPSGATLTAGENPSDITVTAGEENDAGRDGYVLPAPTGNVCGKVFEDTNGNGMQDSGEIGVAGIEVTIMDANGESTTVTTDDNGDYCANNIVEGTATITVNDATLPTGSQLTAGENPNDITVVANENNDAGKDGYITPLAPGSTCGIVAIDTNTSSGAWYESADIGIEGVTVRVTDSQGVVHTRTTDANGFWCIDEIPAGNATADVDDSTLPEGAVQVYGMDPNTVNIVSGEYTSSRADGYILPDTCPVGFESLIMNIYTGGSNTSTNLQTPLSIGLPNYDFTIAFTNVQTSDVGGGDQPYEQFKIVAVDADDNVLGETGYTTDIDHSALEVKISDLGTLFLGADTDRLLLVHRADSVYGDDLASTNSVRFNSLCYKINAATTNHP